MKKSRIIIVLLLAAALGAAAFWSVESYIQSPAIIEKIRLLISRRVGGNLSFQQPRLRLLRGLELQQVRLDVSGGRSQPFLSLDNAALEYSPLSLLRNRIEFKTIRLTRPRLLFAQQSDGTWSLPCPDPEAARETMTFEAGFFKFEILLNNLDLQDGRVEVRTADNEPLLQALGLDLKGGLQLLDVGAAAHGMIFVKKIQIGPRLLLQDVHSHMDYADDALHLPDLTGAAHGGGVTGVATINMRGLSPSYQASLKFNALDLLTLIRDFGGNPELIQGKVDLNCDMEGSLKQPAVVSGKGSIESHDTQLTGLKALDALGALLNLPELRYNKFDSIKGTFKISDEHFTIYDLEAISTDLKMTGTGRIGFDRSLDFDILLILSPDLTRKIPPDAAQRFSVRDNGGRAITFKLGGTVDEPTSNLADKLKSPPRPGTGL